MSLKPLMIAGALVLATSALAQQNPQSTAPQQQPQAPAAGRTNAQGEQPAPGRTMQEKDTSITNQSGGAPGATGSTGTQSGTTPTTGTNTGTTK